MDQWRGELLSVKREGDQVTLNLSYTTADGRPLPLPDRLSLPPEALALIRRLTPAPPPRQRQSNQQR
jgi:hypothetical protein